MYLVAILLPPLAVLLSGKPVQFLLNIPLTLMFYFPGAVHAVLVVHERNENRRADRIVEAIRRGQYAH